MRNIHVAVVMIMGCWIASGANAAWAEQSKPIQELPGDLVKWSTLWVEVPRQMYGVGQDDGPLAAMTWGPVKGTVMFVNVTTKALWDVAQPDGPILRYEF